MKSGSVAALLSFPIIGSKAFCLVIYIVSPPCVAWGVSEIHRANRFHCEPFPGDLNLGKDMCEYFTWELNPMALPEISSGYVICCEKDPELGVFCVFSNVYGFFTVIIDYTLESTSCPSQIPGLEPFILVIVFISCIGVVIVSVYKKGIKIKHQSI